ncbi:MAG: CotH kinase family protein [Clostridia bacterium]|nr:CotH kinase family protein [Clostridia bacterium]
MKKLISLALLVFMVLPMVFSTFTMTAHADEGAPSFDGVVLSRVCGNGGKKDAACKYSFIELYNTTDADVSLSGLAIYYKEPTSTQYSEFDLPANAVIPAGGYYLVRGNPASKYDTTYEIISVTQRDADWGITISNKEYGIVLAPAGMTLDVSLPLYDLEGIVSYFCAYDSTKDYFFDSGYQDDTSKNKFAVRTALSVDSGWYMVNLTKANSSKLRQIVPKYSGGEAGAFVKSALNEVTFSSPSGFYDNAFSLTLGAKDGYTIYYTLDGSDPTTSSTAMTYTAPLYLDDTGTMGYGTTTSYVASVLGNSYLPRTNDLPGGHVIKAYATNGTDATDVYTSSYFISAQFAGYGVDIVSISLDKEAFVGTNGFYNNYHINDASVSNPRSHAMMEVFDETGERRGYSEIEVSISGHGSARDFDMKSMKIFYKKDNNQTGGKETKLYYDIFDGTAKNCKGQAITTNNRIILRSSSHDQEGALMRDGYHQLMSQELDINTQAIAPTLVFINGEFWGLYNFRERYCEEYVENHYGVAEENASVLENDFRAAVEDHDGNAPYVVSSGPADAADDFDALVTFIKTHNMASAENYAYVCEHLDVHSLMDMYILRLYFNCLDWPLNNIKVWRNVAGSDDPSGCDDKWHYLMLDCDFGSGGKPSVQMDANVAYTDNNFHLMNATNCVTGTVMSRLLANSDFKNEYLTRFYDAIQNKFDYETKALPIINQMVAERSQFVPMMVSRWGVNTVSKYNSSVNTLTTYAQRRKSYAISFLCSYFNITERTLRVLSGFEEIALHGSAYDFFLINDTIQNPSAHGDTWFAENYPDGVVNGTNQGYQTVGFQGWVGFTDAIDSIGYRINGGDPVYSSSFFRSTESTVLQPEHGGQYARRFRVTVPVAALEGENEIELVAKVCGQVMVIEGFGITYVNDVDWQPENPDPQDPQDPDPQDPQDPDPQPDLPVNYHGASFDSIYVNNNLAPCMNGSAGSASPKLDAVGRLLDYSDGSATKLTFKGWIGFEELITGFGYQIDDNDPVFGNFAISTEEAVRYNQNGGPNAHRFAVEVPVSGLQGDHNICVVVRVGGYVVRIDENIPKCETQAKPNTSLTFRGPAAPEEPPVEPDEPEVLLGDIDGDSLITSKDVNTLKKYLVGIYSDEDINMVNADVNGDGDITTKDMRSLKALLAS